jgi:hypothetical protein
MVLPRFSGLFPFFTTISSLSSCIILIVFISLLCHQSRHRLPTTLPPTSTTVCMQKSLHSPSPLPAVFTITVFHDNPKNPQFRLDSNIPTTLCAPPSLSRPFVRLLHRWSPKLLRRCYTACSHLNSAIPAIVVEISDILVCCALGVGVEVFFLTCSPSGLVVVLLGSMLYGCWERANFWFELFPHICVFSPRKSVVVASRK